MKYIVLLCDGMSDFADENGQTPMSLANKPNMDKLSAVSEVGLCNTVPVGMKPGSDTANLSVMGYDPEIYYSGRSPLEAASMGIPLDEKTVTYRCNLVTLSTDEPYENKTMLDYSAGEITTDEAAELINFLKTELDSPLLTLYSGISYRHCLVKKEGAVGAKLTPPHDISDQKITEFMPSGEFSDELTRLMKRSYELLIDHPVNAKRVAEGKKPANSIWLWGEGKKPLLDNFQEKYGLTSAVISAVDLIKGIGVCAGMDIIEVEGATGNLHTNFDGKAAAAVDALKTHDYVYLHIEAPDECGHQGDKAGKIRAIELIDQKVLSVLLEKVAPPYKILILPDHATPVSTKTHAMAPVPYLLYNTEKKLSGAPTFTESTAASTGKLVEKGCELILKLTNNE